MRFGSHELLLVLLIVIVLFGPTQLPKLFKMFGKSMKGFKQGLSEDDKVEVDEAETKKTAKKDQEGDE